MTVSAAAQPASQNGPDSVTVKGTVRNAAGGPVDNAIVRMELKGAPDVMEAKTNAAGVFIFSALKTGTYVLRAEKSGASSRASAIIAAVQGDQKQVDLILEDAEKLHSEYQDSSPSSNQAMEFADNPNFTIAGVTDWTAAGGHGSDSTLRTSEALTRETLALKAGQGTSASPAVGAGSADLHRKAGEQNEKLGNPLAAVHEFELAARMDPSEQNYFEWGSELLLHRAVWQAQEVFAKGAQTYPKSVRMLTALGTALFSGAFYDQAALRLCDASDLNPADPEPYEFLGKIEMASPDPLTCVEQKLARFVHEQPENALANYLYAMALWKQQQQSADPQALLKMEALLTKAVSLNAKCADAYLQLGILNASRRDFHQAIDFYTKAIDANPELAEAYYRLGVAYDRIGDPAKAALEFQLHDQKRKQQAAAVERERREVKQFLVVKPGQTPDPQAH
ncbi:MAG: carboxypeptidase regulatory-like domain-containing protein [Terracidiphilus sp.]